jgi:hypothetical protein
MLRWAGVSARAAPLICRTSAADYQPTGIGPAFLLREVVAEVARRQPIDRSDAYVAVVSVANWVTRPRGSR